jgi:CheY-like chemotaxis protein
MPDSDAPRRAILVVAAPGRIENVTRALIGSLADVGLVSRVGSGPGAIAALEAGCVDLVVWDVTNFCGQGWRALAEARVRWPAVPAVVLADDAADRGAALAAGVDAVLERHYCVDALLATIAGLLVGRDRPVAGRTVGLEG